MRHIPYGRVEQPVSERRKKGRRAADLDGAYNDGAAPAPLRLGTALRLYGSIAWIVGTSALGSLLVLKYIWNSLAVLFSHG